MPINNFTKNLFQINNLNKFNLECTSLYEDIILSIASAAECSRFRAVVKACVLSLTPPSGSSSINVPESVT